MKKMSLTMSVCLGMSFATLLPHQISASELVKIKPRPLYVEGELLVKPKASLGIASASRFVAAAGDVVAKQVANSDLMLVKLDAGDTVEAAMTRYQASSGFDLVQPNYKYYASALPNDANMGQLWGLHNTGQTVSNASYSTNNPGTSGNDIDASLAWDLHTDCSNTIVAVVDTGINYTHADLAANMWTNAGETPGNATDDDGNGVDDDIYGYDALDDDGDPMSTDGQNHGTHVAGTIGAVGNNAQGMTGVCQTAEIMAIRALGVDGGTTASVVAGLNYAVANGAKVVNMSLGGGGNDTSFSNAIDAARTAGVVIVVAAGNDGADTDVASQYPCNYPQDNVVCVAALDQSYELASFSNYGTTHVDVGAPGTNVHSAWAGTQISDDFSTGWTGVQAQAAGAGNPDQWTESDCALSSGTYQSLVNPFPQCNGNGGYGPYANGQDDRAYKNFDLSAGYLGASLEFYARVRTTDTNDYLRIGFDNGNASNDPFDSTGGDTTLDTISGDQGTSWYLQEYDLANCLNNDCDIGFQFVSDSTGINSDGVSIILMNINTVENGSTEYSVINGTSMATPHAAGVAALVYSYNTNYTATEVANALKNSGEDVTALTTTTTTGKAINAYNALRYIQPPQNVTAVVQ